VNEHTKGSDPATACITERQTADGYTIQDFNIGLTKREHFAALAMQGFCAAPNMGAGADVARLAVAFADELIAALNKESP